MKDSRVAETGERPVVVYSTASFPPQPPILIYTILTGSLKFAESIDPGGSRPLEIRLLPLTVRDWVTAPARRLVRKFRRLVGWSPGLPTEAPADINPKAFAARAVGRHGIMVATERRSVRVASQRAGFHSLVPYARALAAAYPLWRTCFAGTKFDYHTFLDLTFEGILIGDYAASEHLRWVRNGDGRLAPSLGLFLMLADCVFICQLCARLQPGADAGVISLEPTYRHAVYQRALRQKGVSQIDTRIWESGGFDFTRSDEDLLYCFRVARANRPLTDADRTAAAKYLAARLADPVAHIGYLDTGHNDNSRRQLVTATDEEVVLDSERLHATVFLHSFDDAQYLYGNDGFSDLVDWAVFTITACLENPAIDKVLIKPHPATWSGQYANTQRGEAFLQNRFRNNPKVTWLAPSASLVALSEIGTVIGITHHGSVAEELVFLDVPVIGYRHAAWSEGYTFVRGWSNPAEYAELIRRLSLQSFQRPTISEKESLFAYVRECRLVPGKGEYEYFHEFRVWLSTLGDARSTGNRQTLHTALDDLGIEDATRYLNFVSKTTTAEESTSYTSAIS